MPAFLFFILTTAALSLLLAYLPNLSFVVAILWGAMFIVGAVYINRKQLMLLFSFNILLLWLLGGGGALFFYTAFFGLTALIMGLLTCRQEDYYGIQKWGILGAVLGVSIFLLLIYFSTGSIGIQEAEEQLTVMVEDSMKMYEELGFFEAAQQQGVTREEIESSMKNMVSGIALHLPAFYYLQAILAAFFMLLLASYATLKRGIERLKKKPFNQEIMPWKLVWVIILGLALWLLGWEEKDYVYYAGSNVIVVLTPIAIYYGMAALVYRLRGLTPLGRRWTTVTVVILSVLFPLSAVGFFSIIGMFDSLLDLRKIRTEQEE